MEIRKDIKIIKKTGLIKKLLLILLIVIMVLVLGIGLLYGNKVRTILSLKKIDNHPLYSMNYYGGYNYEKPRMNGQVNCSAFLATNEKGEPIFCRNLDYTLAGHPVVALHTAAHGKNASISMSDLYYLGYNTSNPPARSLIKGWAMLNAPKVPIDGMNEYGVALAMLSVPDTGWVGDTNKPTIDEVGCNRLMLDNAKNIDEAINEIKKYNLKFNAGPIHYMIADVSGNSAVVEFIDGKVVVNKKQGSYQAVTNFIISKGIGEKVGIERYHIICDTLNKTKGQLTEKEAMKLLSEVSQSGTLWSVIYNLKTGEIQVAMDKKYDQIRKLKLNMMNIK